MSSIHDPRDAFDVLMEINKASAVVLVECGILTRSLGRVVADALVQVGDAQAKPLADRPADYLMFERLLVAQGGIEVSRLHSGRSRQDITATIERLALRNGLIAMFEKLQCCRQSLLQLTGRYAHSIIPAYTWGVQAQPITFGHSALAYCNALARCSERIKEAYVRINRCPLGSAALGTSSFPLDRNVLAALLGMDEPIVNSFDAIQIAPIDGAVEVTGIVTSTALIIGGFIAECSVQYAQVRPWITMRSSDQTGISSIMPQKRNPTGLVMLRAMLSNVIGRAQTVTLLSHNIQPGMSDYKGYVIDPEGGGTLGDVFRDMEEVLIRFNDVLGVLELNEARALEEVERDYSTSTELADTLQREFDVPFRVGHEFASRLVSYGREYQLAPFGLPFRIAQTLFEETSNEQGFSPGNFPMTEAEFHKSLSAANMIASSRGLGGPQPDEVIRMISVATGQLQDDHEWLTRSTKHVADSDALRNRRFLTLLQESQST